MPEEQEEQIQEQEEKPKSKKEQDNNFLGKTVNELLSTPEVEPFKKMILKDIKKIKEYEPFLDPKKTYAEIESINPNIALELISDDDIEIYTHILDEIQGYLDRLTYLSNRAEREHSCIKYYYDHLYLMWVGKFSRLSSDIKRKGEAEYILDFMFDQLVERSNLLNTIQGITKNLANKKDTVSRKVTIIQETHRIIGSAVGEAPDKIKEAKEKHRVRINEKLKEYKEKHTGPGWDRVPSATYLYEQDVDKEIEDIL